MSNRGFSDPASRHRLALNRGVTAQPSGRERNWDRNARLAHAALDSTMITAYQRLAGNQAVARMLIATSPPRAGSSVPTRPIQRQIEDDPHDYILSVTRGVPAKDDILKDLIDKYLGRMINGKLQTFMDAVAEAAQYAKYPDHGELIDRDRLAFWNLYEGGRYEEAADMLWTLRNFINSLHATFKIDVPKAVESSSSAPSSSMASGFRSDVTGASRATGVPRPSTGGAPSKVLVIKGPGKVESPSPPLAAMGEFSLPSAIKKLKDMGGSKAPMIAVMWFPDGTWISGHARWATQKPTLPANAPEFLKKVRFVTDAQDWDFGTNCAEFHCVFKALKMGKVSFRGCVFLAARPGPVLMGPCKSCNAWINNLGAKSFSKRDAEEQLRKAKSDASKKVIRK